MAYLIAFLGGYLLCAIHSGYTQKEQPVKSKPPEVTENQVQWERLLNFNGTGEE